MIDEHVHVRPMCAVTIKYKNTFKNVLWLKIWSHIKYHLKYSNFCWLIHKVYIIDNCKGKYIIHVLVVFIITWAYKETLQKKEYWDIANNTCIWKGYRHQILIMFAWLLVCNKDLYWLSSHAVNCQTEW